jgi:hypothetical protein
MVAPTKGTKRPASSSSSSSALSVAAMSQSVSSKDDVENKRRKLDALAGSVAPPLRDSVPANKKNKSISSSSSSSSSSTVNKNNQNKNAKIGIIDDDLTALLKAHNKKVGPKAAYEHTRHSVRDVRKWELLTGKIWATLNPEEREKANNDISEMKQS